MTVWRKAPSTWRIASDFRSDIGKVSGIRTALQISASTPYSISNDEDAAPLRQQQHGLTEARSAITGTAMNTIMASDMTLAIAAPCVAVAYDRGWRSRG